MRFITYVDNVNVHNSIVHARSIRKKIKTL